MQYVFYNNGNRHRGDIATSDAIQCCLAALALLHHIWTQRADLRGRIAGELTAVYALFRALGQHAPPSTAIAVLSLFSYGTGDHCQSNRAGMRSCLGQMGADTCICALVAGRSDCCGGLLLGCLVHVRLPLPSLDAPRFIPLLTSFF